MLLAFGSAVAGLLFRQLVLAVLIVVIIALPLLRSRARWRRRGIRVATQVQTFVNGYTQHPRKLFRPLTSIGASVAPALAAAVIVVLTAL